MIDHRAAEGPWRGRVVHLATRLDDRTLALLAPATAALARSGQVQSLVVIDDALSRGRLGRLDDAVRVVQVPPLLDPLAQWRALGAAFADQFDGTPPAAVHMHGDIARLLGERVLRDLESDVPRFHSSAGRGVLDMLRPLALVARVLGRRRSGPARSGSIENGSTDRVLQDGLDTHPATVLEGPVRAAYFARVPSSTARRPLIVSASRACDATAAAAFDQLAVLLGGEGLGLAFLWIGPLDGQSAPRLRAADVGMLDAHDEPERAARLADAWMYVALSEVDAFPICLAEAMAAGLPCVAMDTPAHRGLVRHGETGYLCRNLGEVIERIALLADSPDVRRRLGHGGRALAQARFGEALFAETLLAAYAALGPAAPQAQPHLRLQPQPQPQAQARLPARAVPAAMERP